MTSRLEYCKKELENGVGNDKKIDSLLQELVHLVVTYNEKKALKDYASLLKMKS